MVGTEWVSSGTEEMLNGDHDGCIDAVQRPGARLPSGRHSVA